MINKLKFRFKMFISLVVVILLMQGLQLHSWYHAGDLLFNSFNFESIFNLQIRPLLLQVLPVIIIIGFIFYHKMKFLESAVNKLNSGIDLSSRTGNTAAAAKVSFSFKQINTDNSISEQDLAKAKKDLLAVPIWVFASSIGASALGFFFQFIFMPQAYLTLVGFINFVFDLLSGVVSSFLLLGIFDLFLDKPRELLYVTQIDDSLGKRTPNHRTTSLFVIFLMTWILLFSLTMGVRYAQVQDDYIQAIHKIAAGEDKTEVSKNYFQQQFAIYPNDSQADSQDIMAINPGAKFIEAYFIPPVILLLILGIAIWQIGTRRQAKDLIRIRDRMNQALEGGDLETQLKITNFDEVGELASAINTLTRLQSQRILKLTQAATSVESSFKPLAEVTQQSITASKAILNSSTKIAEKANQELGNVSKAESTLDQALQSFEVINKSVESLAQLVADSSSAMTEIASSIASVTKQTDEAKTLTEQLKVNSQSGSQSLKASVESIRSIESTSKEVNDLTSEIAKISAQTNLLAMNAAIEAAHAGQTGAGFAVVANEVRNLALRSAESNKKIKQKTTEMLTLVEQGVSLTTQVGQSFEQINTAIASTVAIVSEINAAMKEQNQGTEQTLKSTEAMVVVSQKIQANSENQKEQNAKLREAVSQLTSTFNEIHQGASETAKDGERIREAVTRLEVVATGGQQVVDQLASLVSKPNK